MKCTKLCVKGMFFHRLWAVCTEELQNAAQVCEYRGGSLGAHPSTEGYAPRDKVIKLFHRQEDRQEGRQVGRRVLAAGVTRECVEKQGGGYFPMQKLEKISPKRASLLTVPVMVPRALWQ